MHGILQIDMARVDECILIIFRDLFLGHFQVMEGECCNVEVIACMPLLPGLSEKATTTGEPYFDVN